MFLSLRAQLRQWIDLSPFTRAALVALLACTTSAHATQPPACAPANLVFLDQATADTLMEASQNGISRYTLVFAGTPPLLQTVTTDNSLYVPPTAALVSGVQGPVLAIDVGPTDTTVTLTRRERWPNPSGVGLGDLLFTTGTDAGDTSCEDFGTPVDSDNDGDFDAGVVSGTCEGDGGSEYGFQLEIVDGVTINGGVAVAPFDISTEAEFDEGELTSALFTNTGRISFSGELSADVDATMPERPIRLGTIPVATHRIEVPMVGTITIAIEADMFVGACGSVTAGTRTGVTSTGIVDFGIEVNNGEPAKIIANLSDSTIEASPPQLASDTPVDITLYGGGDLRVNMDLDAGGVLPFVGADLNMVVRGSVNTLVDPAADPWWDISGRPEVYLDISPELLTADVANYAFSVINPPPTTFFTSTTEFPFPPPTAARTNSEGGRESGSALRWSRAFLSEEDYRTVAVVPASDGGALLVASSTGSGALIRTDFQGERVWQRRVEGGFEVAEARQLPDGSFLLGGLQGTGLWLARVSDSGSLIWAREFDPVDNNIQSLRFTKAENGQITMGGQLVDLSNGNDVSPWAASIGSSGNVLWWKRYGQTAVDEGILDTAGLADGGLLLVGETAETPPGPTLENANAYTLRLLANGNVAWSHVWASSTIDTLLSAAQAPDGSYIVGGTSGGGSPFNSAPRGLLMRFDNDQSGAPTQARWIRAIGGTRTVADTAFDQIKGIVPATDGFIVTGSSRNGTARTGWLARLVERGSRIDLIWSYFYDGVDNDDLVALTNIGDGVLAGGTSRSFPDGSLDNALWLARAPLNGFLGFNDESGAVAASTNLLLSEPPRFSSSLDPQNITSQAMITALEQTADLTIETADAELLSLGPVGFVPVELVREPLPVLDSDGDGIRDELDNCSLVPNPDQRDADTDGFGNLCDADLNNDGIVNAVDLGLFRTVFFSSDEDADFNGDGVVNAIDLGTLKLLFFAPPGPSGLVP